MLAIVSIVLLIPIFYVLGGIVIPGGENWEHLKDHLLSTYVFNTILLVIFTSILSIAFGVLPAWYIARYDFPLKKVFSVLLVLPLAIPSYIMAFAYSGFFNVFGSLHFFLMDYFPNINYKLDINNWLGLSFVLALALFPYVYLILHTTFKIQQENLLEAAQTLGANSKQVFLKIALPLARPALAGGLFLIIMEVLNDYGAASYFGVKTLTTGIFRTWFSLGDIQTAVKLAGQLLGITLLFYIFEQWIQSHKKYSSSRIQRKSSYKNKLTKVNSFIVIAICFIPTFFGFLLPLFQLLYWAFQSESISISVELIKHSAQLAALVTILCLLIAFINAFGNHYFKNKWMKIMVRVSSIGYAIPGAIIAVGVLAPLLWLDDFTNWNTGTLINASIFALTYACVIRFFAVSYNSLEGVISKLPPSYADACKLNGVNSFKALGKVYFPLSKTGLLAGGILVFIDVLKELPLTLILRPFDFNTLATKAFELASDEALREASIPALCIVAMGCLALFLVKIVLKTKYQ